MKLWRPGLERCKHEFILETDTVSKTHQRFLEWKAEQDAKVTYTLWRCVRCNCREIRGEKVMGWIDAKERQPTHDGLVLVYVAGIKEPCLARYYRRSNLWEVQPPFDEWLTTTEVCEWRPMEPEE